MSSKDCHYLSGCLYFTANSLSRNMTEIARKEFSVTGLDPSYADLMILIYDRPGLSQNELGRMMNLTPSTITRFLDKMIDAGLVRKELDGRMSFVYPTEEGEKKSKLISKALHNLYLKYCEKLGEDVAIKLTHDIYEANKKLEE
jgi:DNA-binding MarR family transcriptional regulator